MLSSDWLDTNLTLCDVWLVGSNVRLAADSKKIHNRDVINVRLAASNSNPISGQ